jgi:hypothetical protein
MRRIVVVMRLRRRNLCERDDGVLRACVMSVLGIERERERTYPSGFPAI